MAKPKSIHYIDNEKFFKEMESMEGVRLPGQRRHNNRKDKGPRYINSELIQKIKSLSE